MGVLGILFLASGAILTFAVHTSISGMDLDAVGVILMIVGVVGVVASATRNRFPTIVTRAERVVADDGDHVVEQRRTEGV